MTFDITVPVLNEAPTLAQQIKILHAFLRTHFPVAGQWRIVIADNGSTDDTFAIAERLAAVLPEVAVVKVPRRGVGLALKTSWGQSQADIVGYMDLDLATDLPHFLEAYAALAEQSYDIVYATRLHPQAKVIGRTLRREIASRGFNWLLKRYLGVHFSDGMCGFKFLRRAVYPQLYERGAQNDGWFFSTELLTVAEWMGLKIYELPVRWTDDVSSSRVKILPLAKRYLQDMHQLKKRKGVVRT
ncbi:MAG TPA: glycosyltransferase [Saprospiraceae bacterium]|nr:glycosyltransferase [Saprospiraceae bacterium]HMP23908.1 glycosyltransferase [Saprospiraceae bacterium]